MPLARYFTRVGIALLALIFIADACLPDLPARKPTDAPAPVIRIHSEWKRPDRIDFDTSTPLPAVAAAANLDPVSPAQPTAALTSGRVREAVAQLQAPEIVQMQVTGPGKPEAQRKQKLVKRQVVRLPPRIPRWPQHAWYGGRMWW